MKKLFIVSLGLLLTMSMVSLPVAASEVHEELAKILGYGIEVMDQLIQDGYTIEHLELDMLSMGQTYTFDQPVDHGYYRLVGIGGPGIGDLDLYTFDEDGNPVAQDRQDDAMPVVDLDVTGHPKVTIKASVEALEQGYASDVPYYFVVIIAGKDK